jgi:hypothetical protein
VLAVADRPWGKECPQKRSILGQLPWEYHQKMCFYGTVRLIPDSDPTTSGKKNWDRLLSPTKVFFLGGKFFQMFVFPWFFFLALEADKKMFSFSPVASA